MERRKTLFTKVCTIEFIDNKAGKKANVKSAPKLHRVKKNTNSKIVTLMKCVLNTTKKVKKIKINGKKQRTENKTNRHSKRE